MRGIGDNSGARPDWSLLYGRMNREERREFWKRCRAEPAFYAEAVLGVRLWGRQRDILNALAQHPRVAVKSCHASGKSFVAAVGVCWFIHTRQNAVVATTAPTFRQVEKVLWGEVRGLWKRGAQRGFAMPGRLYGTEIKIDDKWYAFGFSTDDPDRFQGLHSESILVVLDEASGILPAIWPAVEGVLSGGDAKLLSIGNPTDPGGEFYREFNSLPASARFTISAYDTPNLREGRTVIRGLVTPEWVESVRKRWGEKSALFISRVLGDFPPAGPDTLIPLAWIERAQRRWEHLDTIEEALRKAGAPIPVQQAELGCDIARYGDDATVFAERRGPRVRIVYEENGCDTMATAGRITALARELGCNPKIDVIGIGAGVVDRVREDLARYGMTAHEMNASEAAIDREHYANIRAEWLWTLREAFEHGLIALDPTDTETAHELSSIKFKYSAGKILIEPKDDTKKRIGRSPDRADAVMLAWAKPFYLGVHAPVVGAVAIPPPPVVF